MVLQLSFYVALAALGSSLVDGVVMEFKYLEQDKFLEAAENFRMITDQTLNNCYDACYYRQRCRSFNWYRNMGLCWLYEHGSNNNYPLDNRAGFVYSEKKFWKNKPTKDECNCKWNETCNPKRQGKMKCRIEECGPYQNLNENMTLLGNQYAVGKKLMLKCKQGLKSVGNKASFKCTREGWEKTDLQCLPYDCHSPKNITNGTLMVNNGTTLYSKAVYSCDPGFQLIGEATVKCLATESWESPPECKLIDCGQPDEISDGKVSVNQTTVNSTAMYVCNQDFRIVGNATVKCLETGKWEERPDCESYNSDFKTAILCPGTEGVTCAGVTISCSAGHMIVLGRSFEVCRKNTCTVAGVSNCNSNQLSDCCVYSAEDNCKECENFQDVWTIMNMCYNRSNCLYSGHTFVNKYSGQYIAIPYRCAEVQSLNITGTSITRYPNDVHQHNNNDCKWFNTGDTWVIELETLVHVGLVELNIRQNGNHFKKVAVFVGHELCATVQDAGDHSVLDCQLNRPADTIHLKTAETLEICSVNIYTVA